jgi:hypothetical protein
MQPLRRCPLSIEQLEARDCPSLTISDFSGNLTVSGVPSSTLLIQETGTNVFQVMDGAVFHGAYSAVSNIYVKLSSRPADLNVQMNATGLGGNLLLDLGTGFTSTGMSHTVHVFGGRIGGSLTGLHGNGNETYDLGFDATGGTSPLRVGGSVSITAPTSAGSGGGSPRDHLFLQSGSSIGLDLTTTNVDSVFLAPAMGAFAASSVGRNVSVSNSQEHTTPDTFLEGNIGQDVTVNGPVTGIFVDLGALGPVTVGRNLSISTLGGDSIVGLAAGSVVAGNATITTAAGNDFIEMGGQVNGSASVSTGEGNDTFLLDPTALVAGTLGVTSGNGNDTLTVSGTVNGNLNLTVGNGGTMATPNTITVNTAPGGLLTFQGGNGTDVLDLEGPSGTFYNVNLLFGTGTNTLTLDSGGTTPFTLSGTITGSGGSNTFNQNGATLVNVTFNNFP